MYPIGYTPCMNTVNLSDEFRAWFGGLKDLTARVKILRRIERLESGNPGDVKHFDGLSEMRIDHGPGYRVYYAKEGKEIYLVLAGGAKSTQRADITKAKAMLAGRKR